MIHAGLLDKEGIEVLVDENACSLLIQKLCGDRWVVTSEGRHPNLRVLAEELSDALGYGLAVQFLREAGVPETSALWTLNHKGGRTHFTANG